MDTGGGRLLSGPRMHTAAGPGAPSIPYTASDVPRSRATDTPGRARSALAGPPQIRRRLDHVRDPPDRAARRHARRTCSPTRRPPRPSPRRPPTCRSSCRTSASSPTSRCSPSARSSPLTGFQSEADYHSVLDSMHLTNGLAWAIPVVLGVDEDEAHQLGGGGSVALLPAEGADPIAVLRVSGTFKRDKAEGGRARSTGPTTTAHPGVKAVYDSGDYCVAGDLEVHLAAVARRLPGLPADAGRDARRVREARVEDRGGVPDPQPDPPRARVHPEVRARDRRRPARAPADGRHEVRRRAARRADAVLRGALRGLLPEGPRDGLDLPGRDALRGSARGDLARDLPQELRLHALHRRSRPRGRRHLLRHVRRAGRSSTSSSRASSASRR